MNKRTKIILFILLLLIDIFLLIKKMYLFSIIIILLSFVPILLIFRNEYLLLAFLKISQKDMEGLNKYLNYIKNTRLQLTKGQIAYFYFLKGISYLNKDMIKSELYMRKSLDSGLKFKQNIAIAKFNLAIATLSKGNKEEAKKLLSEAKKMDVSGILKNQIKIINQQIKKYNIGRGNIQNPFFRKKL